MPKVNSKIVDNVDTTELFSRLGEQFVMTSLDAYLPKRLADVCLSLAKNNCVPLQGMLLVVLALTAAYCPSSFVIGIGNIIQPVMLQLIAIGFPSTNKSKTHDIATQTVREVNAALQILRQSHGACKEHRLRIPGGNIPKFDKSGSYQAMFTGFTRNRNQLRI